MRYSVQLNLTKAVILLLATILVAVASNSSEARAADIDFNRQIRPILSQNCFYCHGPDKSHREADLRLDVKDFATAKPDGAILVPGKSEESALYQRVTSTNPDERMPPADSGKQLQPEQIELLKRWIDEGAKSQGHWAFDVPARPVVPPDNDPIDFLVEKSLAPLGLNLSPTADRQTLARRLWFDLLGLPPRPEDVDAFVNSSAPDAYEQLVERLLSSPQYGERMAIGWLDIVRFADTIGYHSDGPRNVWPYRDWVIRAFNENKPFDQFTIDQLAGDLLPDNTVPQRVASCFNRLLLTTEEGGAQIKDYESRMLADRVRAVGTIWLGQTLGCCQCHDHKYDPATARDFYSLGAFFSDIGEPIIRPLEPGMPVPTEEQAAHLAQLKAQASELSKEYDSAAAQRVVAQQAWEETLRAEAASPNKWQLLKPTEVTGERGTKLSIESDGSILVDVKSAQDADIYVLKVPLSIANLTGLRIDVLPHDKLPNSGPGLASNTGYMLSEFEATVGDASRIALSHASATFEDSGLPALRAIDESADDGRGWGATVPGAAQSICFELAQPVPSEQAVLTVKLHQLKGGKQLFGHFRLLATSEAKPVRAPQAVAPSNEIDEIARLEPAKRKPKQQNLIKNAFLLQIPQLVDLRSRVAAANRAANEFENSLPRCLVSSSNGKPRTVRILPRGNWMDESGPIVEPAVPQYLSSSAPAERRLTREDLARWIVSRDNPLTARVFVNRLWKQFFGTGLVKSVDDFGSQGDSPANQEVLDWLACEFIDSGWDVKHIIRVIINSKTYRQTSIASQELLSRDPDNRLLARQGRFRLDAEMVRDNALKISGLLTSTIGGPSVKPYQPDGYWENLNFPTRDYVADQGPSQYRRGLYTWWQRTFLHPSMLAFDAPSRDECAADRPRSNIPQQALVLLNDPTYVEAARALAARTIAEGGADSVARMQWLWRQALARPPREDELATLMALLKKHHQEWAEDIAGRDAFLKVGFRPLPEHVDVSDLAAWTSLARVVLNLHETNTRN